MNKKAIVAIAVMAVAVLAMSCTFKVNKTVTHSKTTKTYTGSAVKPFDRIIIDAFCDVRYVQGDSTCVSISYADPEDFAALDIKNQDGRFVIGYKTSHKVTRLRDDDMLKVVITTPDLIEVDMSGAGQFWSGDPIDTDTLLLQLKGAGKISLGPITAQECDIQLKGVGKIDADFDHSNKVDCDILGVGKIKLSGKVGQYNANVLGTGKIDRSDLVVE